MHHKNMKKTLLNIAVLASIITPSIAFAAWYNPLTWFKKTPVSIQVPAEITDGVSIQPSSSKPVITNTITVENPKLQSQINELIQQNNSLQNQLSILTAKYDAVVKENQSLKDKSSSKSNPNAYVTTNAKGIFTISNLSDSTIHITAIDYSASTVGYTPNKTTITTSDSQDSGELLQYNENNNYAFDRSIIIPPHKNASVTISIYYAKNQEGTLKKIDTQVVPKLTKITTEESVTIDGLPL